MALPVQAEMKKLVVVEEGFILGGSFHLSGWY